MIVCCPRSVLIPCWDPIMGAQRTLFPGQLSTAVLVRRKPLSFLGKHTLRCTAILLEQRKFHLLVFKIYFESEFNNQRIGIWWPVYTNHSFLCTMHSLQSKCTCDLFGHPLGLNLWLWCSGPPTLPMCYAKQLNILYSVGKIMKTIKKQMKFEE